MDVQIQLRLTTTEVIWTLVYIQSNPSSITNLHVLIVIRQADWY